MKTNSQLQLDVLNELKWDPSVHHEAIGAAVNDGVVMLSGVVKSYAEKLNAEKAARRVKGVKAIAEELTVRYDYQPKTGDSEIARRISDVIAWDPLIPHDRVEVTVENGGVRLGGKVDWNYQRDLAFKAASKISGVTIIQNMIQVTAAIDSIVVRERIEQAFERHADLEADKITVRAEGHKVFLGGEVNSWNERSIAERAAWSAPGVSQIQDNIVVA